HSPGHSHTFEYPCRIGCCPNGARCAQTVVLTVRRLANTSKTMALYNSLEAFTFGCARYINILTLDKMLHRNCVAHFVFFFKSLVFGDFSLCNGSCFFGVPLGGLNCSLLVIETKLKRFVPVNLFGSDLGNNTGACLNNGARNIFPFFVKDAGHPYLSSN